MTNPYQHLQGEDPCNTRVNPFKLPGSGPPEGPKSSIGKFFHKRPGRRLCCLWIPGFFLNIFCGNLYARNCMDKGIPIFGIWENPMIKNDPSADVLS